MRASSGSIATCVLIIVFIIALFVVLVGTAIARSRNARETRAANGYTSPRRLRPTPISRYSKKDAEERAAEAKKVEAAVSSLQSEYAGHPLALEGLYILGNTHYELENFAEAQKA